MGLLSLPALFPLPIVATSFLASIVFTGALPAAHYALVHAMAFLAVVLLITVGNFIETRYEKRFNSRLSRAVFTWVVSTLLIIAPMIIVLTSSAQAFFTAAMSSILLGGIFKFTEPIWDQLLNEAQNN